MYMYPVITSNTTTEVSSSSNSNNNNTTTPRTTNNTNMPRNRSLSAASSPPPPALLSRGFASLRRAHRRLSNSSPTSPITAPGENIHITGNNSTPTSSSSAAAAAATGGLGVITDEERNNNNTITTTTSSTDAEISSSTIVRPRIRLVPNVGLSSRSFVFDIIDRELEPGVMYRIGRFSDRNALAERISFKSKVTSRNHAELWTENGKVYIRDIGSSSGTFLNRIRLSPPSHVSTPHEIRDGDAIQLGVDYQGGLEPIYRAVRIRVEINRQYQNANTPFARTAFQQLRSQFIGSSVAATSPPPAEMQDLGLQRETTRVSEQVHDLAAPPHVDLTTAQLPLADMMSRHNISDMTRADIQECCICLYAIAPFQALFIAPCSHIFHFKCLRPIVYQNYPGFACPLCRSYFDLEASVAVEVDEVLEAISVAKEQQKQQQEQQEQQQQITPIDTVPEVNEEEEEDDEEEDDEEDQLVGEERNSDLLDVTVESSIHPSTLSRNSSSNNNEGEEEEVENDIEQKSENNNDSSNTPPTEFLKTLPVPIVSVPHDAIDGNNEVGTTSRPTTSSPAQPIQMNNNGTAAQQLQPRSNRNMEALLSTTLVGSPPVFEENVLPPPAHQNDSSNIVS